MTELDPISVVFTTPEDNLPRIHARLAAGAKLPVTVFDRANVKKLATGELTTFDNQIDTTTGTFKLRAIFANPDNALFPNQFVNARLLVDTRTGVALAPNAAVQIGPSGTSSICSRRYLDCHEARRAQPGATDGKTRRSRPASRQATRLSSTASIGCATGRRSR